MKIRMLKDTNFEGIKRKGEVLESISDSIASRWLKVGLAEEVIDEVKEEPKAAVTEEAPEEEPKEVAEEAQEEETEEETEEDEVVDLDSMTNKELFALCKERGLELTKNRINGKTDDEKHEYLLSVLNKG